MTILLLSWRRFSQKEHTVFRDFDEVADDGVRLA
jgi:hypothetical protein